MRYTEKEYDFVFDSVYDFIRVLFSTTFLAPFRFFNEMSKKIILLGKKGIKDILNTAVIIASLLLAGEFGYQILFTKLSLFSGSVPLISIALALIGVFIINQRVDNFDIEELDIFEECEDKEESKPILNMEKPLEGIVEKPIIEQEEIVPNEKPSEQGLNKLMDKYDSIMDDSEPIDDNLDIVSMLNNLTMEDMDDSNKILEAVKNPINEDGLMEAYSANTMELSGDNYYDDLEKFEKYENIISEEVENDLINQINDFNLEDGYDRISDFFNDDE